MPSSTLSLGEPAGITGAKQKLANFETEEGRTAALDGTFRPRQTDVFVVTSPKCGTTWVQQVVHAQDPPERVFGLLAVPDDALQELALLREKPGGQPEGA